MRAAILGRQSDPIKSAGIAYKQAARVYLRVTMNVTAGKSLLEKGPIVAIRLVEVQSVPGEGLVMEWREDRDGVCEKALSLFPAEH